MSLPYGRACLLFFELIFFLLFCYSTMLKQTMPYSFLTFRREIIGNPKPTFLLLHGHSDKYFCFCIIRGLVFSVCF